MLPSQGLHCSSGDVPYKCANKVQVTAHYNLDFSAHCNFKKMKITQFVIMVLWMKNKKQQKLFVITIVKHLWKLLEANWRDSCENGITFDNVRILCLLKMMLLVFNNFPGYLPPTIVNGSTGTAIPPKFHHSGI